MCRYIINISPGKVGQVLLPDGAWVIEGKVKFTVQSRTRKGAGPEGVTGVCIWGEPQGTFRCRAVNVITDHDNGSGTEWCCLVLVRYIEVSRYLRKFDTDISFIFKKNIGVNWEVQL